MGLGLCPKSSPLQYCFHSTYPFNFRDRANSRASLNGCHIPNGRHIALLRLFPLPNQSPKPAQP